MMHALLPMALWHATSTAGVGALPIVLPRRIARRTAHGRVERRGRIVARGFSAALHRAGLKSCSTTSPRVLLQRRLAAGGLR